MKGYGGAPMQPRQELARHLGGQSYKQTHGAPFGLSVHLPCFWRQPSVFRSSKRRLNIVAILVNLFVPWLLFCFVFWILSFSFHYANPLTSWLIVALIFMISVVPFTLLWKMASLKREKHQEEEEDRPMWYGFLAITCFIAIAAGTLLGSTNYDNNLSKAYDLENLATYRDVDPMNYVGQQMVDAGRIVFNDKTHLDISKSMGFKDSDLYCVAPIVSDTASAKKYHDFWAVGKNCCSGVSADFTCKGYNDARYHGGLRLMDDTSRPFYRLAVQQAEATYGIKTHKPLFFIWGPDPLQYTADLKRAGLAMYTTGILVALCVQLFTIVCALLVFAKVYPSRDENFQNQMHNSH